MKIVKLVAENVKRLKAVEIVPDRALVQITGRNTAGKSSVLDAILFALGGGASLDAQPLRQGEKKGHVTLDLGKFIVTRRFTAAGGTTLLVEAKDGARYPNPQTMLDRLLGELTFDPLAFIRMKAREQFEALRDMVKLDVDLDALDRERKEAFDARTEKNRQAKDLRARLGGVDDVIVDGAETEPLDVEQLLNQVATANERAAEIRKEYDRREKVRHDAGWRRASALDNRREAARLLGLAEQAEAEATHMEAELAALPPIEAEPDVRALTEEITAAQRENAFRAEQRRYRTERHALGNQVQTVEGEADRLTARIEAIDTEKVAAISRAQMPLEGLTFGEGEVLYNGLPLAQASGAEQLRVSVALAMAANPKLRVLRVKDGSLLDEDSLAILRTMAEEQDYQVWLEQVDTTGRVGIYIEDGAVAAIDGVPVESEEAVA